MKLGKTSWLILAIGIFVVALASLGIAYGGQIKGQDQLNQELSQTQLILAKYSPEELSFQQRELENQLAQLESENIDIKARLSQSIESIKVADALFKVAEANDVEITEANLESPTNIGMEGITFRALPIMLTVEGEVPDLILFAFGLNQEFPSGVVKSLKISIPEVTEGEETEKPSANIQLFIYTYEGD